MKGSSVLAKTLLFCLKIPMPLRAPTEAKKTAHGLVIYMSSTGVNLSLTAPRACANC